MSSIEIRALLGSTDLLGLLERQFGSVSLANPSTKLMKVPVSCLGTSARLFDYSRESWSELQRLAPWADALSIPHMRVFDGQADGSASDFRIAQSFVNWWESLRAAEGWQVDVLIETHSTLLTSETILRLQNRLSQPVNLLWDSHHTWFKGQEEPLLTWRSISDWVRHIHIKDSPAPNPQTGAPEYVLPGQGDFPFEGLLATLVDSEFPGPVSLEWERFWHPELPDIRIALNSLRTLFL